MRFTDKLASRFLTLRRTSAIRRNNGKRVIRGAAIHEMLLPRVQLWLLLQGHLTVFWSISVFAFSFFSFVFWSQVRLSWPQFLRARILSYPSRTLARSAFSVNRGPPVAVAVIWLYDVMHLLSRRRSARRRPFISLLCSPNFAERYSDR